MHLKRLEIVGFKSFGNKSTFVFDAPITAIVGPNGSGKSNVVESIRFVLGEQSMKSLRGGSSTDLIFKSPTNKTLSRAAVSLVFDNSKRQFQLSSGAQTISVDFDEVEISREVFNDGSSTYRINQTPVRLKDILELIGSVNIGPSGHHIISQGEADRLLTASSRDRKVMLEEALGLKVYQYRMQESEKKLNKSTEHLKEVRLLIKELEPHLKYLKKQVERLDQAEGLRVELLQKTAVLQQASLRYSTRKQALLADKKQLLHNEYAQLNEEEQGLANVVVVDTFNEQRAQLHASLQLVEERERELVRLSGKLEAGIERIEYEIKKVIDQPAQTISTVKTKRVQQFISELRTLIGSLHTKNNISDVHDTLSNIEGMLVSFEEETILVAPAQIDTSGLVNELDSARSNFAQYEQDLVVAANEKVRIQKELQNVDNASRDMLEAARDNERLLGNIKSKKVELQGQLAVLAREESDIQVTQELCNRLVNEIITLAGDLPELENTDEEKEFLFDVEIRTLERLKIKFEELGGGVGIEARQEFDQTTERYEYLQKESADAETACSELESLLADLSQKLHNEFTSGLISINTAFQSYFVNMFGGGGAEVRLVELKQRKKAVLDEDEESETEEFDEDQVIEYGVEVRVQLPRKRVQDLAMLSGGERSLTSIALLFALSQVNPPPFVVLDETDAALDEANSRKYGLMLRELSSRAQLIVVTHNRETMASGHQLFGVTIGGDGASQVLSVKLEEATQYAK